MDRHQLRQCLQAAGVPDDRYLLVGLDAPRAVREGACILRPNQRSWEVLVWEPSRQPSLTFVNEEEACEYVLNMLAGPTASGAGAASVPAMASVPSQVDLEPGQGPARSGKARRLAEARAGAGAAPAEEARFRL